MFLFASQFLHVVKWKWIDAPRLLRKYKKEIGRESFDDDLKKRIVLYVIISRFTIMWLCTLRGFCPSKEEIKRAYQLAVLIPLLDDLTDTKQLTSAQIRKMVVEDKSNEPKVKLAKILYSTLLSECGVEFESLLNQAALAQDHSMKQQQTQKLSEPELREITFQKGSHSLQLYRVILSHKLIQGEKEALAQLGYLIQYLNDMFDIFKDKNEQQQTLYTQYPVMKIRADEFNYLKDNVVNSVLQLNYNTEYKRRSLLQLYTIISRGDVMTQQLLSCESLTNNKFEIHAYTRQQLVCDMEKWSNIKDSFLYTEKFYSSLHTTYSL